MIRPLDHATVWETGLWVCSSLQGLFRLPKLPLEMYVLIKNSWKRDGLRVISFRRALSDIIQGASAVQIRGSTGFVRIPAFCNTRSCTCLPSATSSEPLVVQLFVCLALMYPLSESSKRSGHESSRLRIAFSFLLRRSRLRSVPQVRYKSTSGKRLRTTRGMP